MSKYISLLFLIFTTYSFSQEWIPIAPLPSAGRDDGIAFSLNNLGFFVTGTADGSDYSESNKLFCYNPENNTWTEKAEFPGTKRQYSSVFTIENKAYLIGGYSEFGTPLNDVWEYNESIDIWTQLNNFTGFSRWDATATSLNGSGYFGLGTNLDSTLSDLWKYNQKTDEWSLIAHYQSSGNRSVLAFPILNKIIFGEGFSVSPITYSSSWFEFNPSQNSWRELTFPGGLRSYGTALSNGVTAMVCGGMNESSVFQNDSYQYDYSGEWRQMNPIGTEGLRGSSGFVIGNDFYLGTGLKEDGTKTNEFYKLSSASIPFSETIVFPNPSNSGFNVVSQPECEVSIYSLDGKMILETNTDFSGFTRINELVSGFYIMRINHNGKHVNLRLEKI